VGKAISRPGSLGKTNRCDARSIARSTVAPHRNLGLVCHHIPGCSGFPGPLPPEEAGGLRAHETSRGKPNINKRKCRNLHTTQGKGDKLALGRNLHNYYRKGKAGRSRNYRLFQRPLKGARPLLWDKEKLDFAFIAKPAEVVGPAQNNI